jgi:septation ring formation regulator EzrA
LRELECNVNHLTAEKRKTTERVRKLKAEREKLLKQVNDTTLTVQKVSDVVDIPGNVWWKAKMFDAELKNASHVSGSKIVTFIMDQGNKMDATLKTMKALIASCTELFPATVESSKEEETSSSYSDLTPMI